MSYCRKDQFSDVYAYPHVDGYFVCCHCSMVHGGNVHFDYRQKLLDHLFDHLKNNDKVPFAAVQRVYNEIQREDA